MEMALFRLGLIAPLLNGQVDNPKAYLEKIYSQVYDVPYYGRKEYCERTLVVGEAGSGKTSGLRTFVVSLKPSLYRVAYFPLSTVTVTDFYRGLAFSLGLEPSFRKVDLFSQIQEAIHNNYSGKKVVPFIILDELQLYSS